jgi:hypothetical protein
MFKELKNLFDSNKMFELLKNEKSILWLKLRAISRKELLTNFVKENNFEIKSTKANDIFEELFNTVKDTNLIDDFIRNNLKVLDEKEEQKLVSELYKIKYFDCGGDYKNALDRYIVDKFIKKYSTFDEIENKLDNEINQAVSGYVKCSWYNHWTTKLIENIFKTHKNVLPAIGEIKQVDFFVNDIPFDLKTTYLPTNFIEKIRKENGLLSEISEYKKIAKDFNIAFNDKNTVYEIREKGLNSNSKDCVNRINEIDNFKKDLLKDCIKNPQKLIQNLYEEQGEMRFDASNRLFLILVDVNDFDNSWKLKRDIDLLKNNIHSYLNKFDKQKILDNPISFKYKFKGIPEAEQEF